MRRLIKIISLVVAISILSATITIAFAGSNITMAKTAYITNINSTGSNLNNDIIDEGKNTIKDTSLYIQQDGETLTISLKLGNDNIVVTAIPDGTSENNNILYYATSCNSEKYEVLCVNFEKEICDSALYFEGYSQEHREYNTVLKIYLKKVSDLELDNGKNLILMESFGFEPNSVEKSIQKYYNKKMIDYWYGNEFAPISSREIDPPAMMSAVPQPEYSTQTIERTFYYLGLTQRHTISVDFGLETTNITRGGMSPQKCRIRVVGKSIQVPDAPNMDSSRESYLHILQTEIWFYAPPNTAVYSVGIDGCLNLREELSDILSVTLGIGLGPLQLSLDIESLIEIGEPVDLNETFEYYDNGYKGNYARMVQIKTDPKFLMTDIGDHFAAFVTIKDYVGQQLNGEVEIFWRLNIVNGATLDESECAHAQSAPISIV